MDLNFNNLATDSNGRLTFSGISSGIDTQGLVNSIMDARRVSARSIEDKIAVNETRVTALDELKTLSKNFADKLDVLRNPVGFLDENVFEAKQAFTDTRATATAPAGHTTSAAGEILGVNITGEPVTATHTVEVVQLARANQLRSDAFTSKTDTLSSLGFTTGDLEINGQTINIGSNDSLLDLRDKINNATDMGVNASVISVSDTESYLVLTSEETGVDNAITFGTGSQAVHNSLGLTSVGTDTAKTEIQTAQNSIIRADNLGVDIERSSNTITDVFEGITLDLFKSEENTEVVIDIEPDLNTIKTAIVGFVDAYNALKSFIDDQQSEVARTEGADPSFGPLNGDTTMRRISQKLSGIITSTVPGLDNGFSSLGQVGIDVNQEYLLEVDESELDSNLLGNLNDIQKLFGLDVSVSDSRVSVLGLEENTSYQVDGSGNPLPYYLSIAGTDGSGNVTAANLTTAAGSGAGGADDGSVTANGTILDVTSSSGAEGLSLAFIGDPGLGAVNDIEVTFTRGVADSLYDFFNDVSKTSGIIDDAKDDLLEQNENLTEDVTRIDQRLELQRATLTNKFLAMEEAMFRLDAIKQQLQQQIDALNGGDS